MKKTDFCEEANNRTTDCFDWQGILIEIIWEIAPVISG
jgi:hypothetical protein